MCFGSGTGSKICAWKSQSCAFSALFHAAYLTFIIYLSIQTSTRTHPLSMLWCDANILLLAMAVHHEIFVENIVELFCNGGNNVPYWPYKLTLQEGKGDLPVCITTSGEAFTYNSLQKVYARLADSLGWERKLFLSL
jgi:hypothetical protein